MSCLLYRSFPAAFMRSRDALRRVSSSIMSEVVFVPVSYTHLDQYKNRTEAYKTDEKRYSEEQDAIDRETKKKLREMEQEEKMQKLPSTAPEEIKTIRVSQDKFEEYTGEYRKPYMITKDDGFKVGNVVKLVVFAAGKATGETADMRITCKDDDITCSGLSDGWCVIGLGEA